MSGPSPGGFGMANCGRRGRATTRAGDTCATVTHLEELEERMAGE